MNTFSDLLLYNKLNEERRKIEQMMSFSGKTKYVRSLLKISVILIGWLLILEFLFLFYPDSLSDSTQFLSTISDLFNSNSNLLSGREGLFLFLIFMMALFLLIWLFLLLKESKDHLQEVKKERLEFRENLVRKEKLNSLNLQIQKLEKKLNANDSYINFSDFT